MIFSKNFSGFDLLMCMCDVFSRMEHLFGIWIFPQVNTRGHDASNSSLSNTSHRGKEAMHCHELSLTYGTGLFDRLNILSTF